MEPMMDCWQFMAGNGNRRMLYLTALRDEAADRVELAQGSEHYLAKYMTERSSHTNHFINGLRRRIDG